MCLGKDLSYDMVKNPALLFDNENSDLPEIESFDVILYKFVGVMGKKMEDKYFLTIMNKRKEDPSAKTVVIATGDGYQKRFKKERKAILWFDDLVKNMSKNGIKYTCEKQIVDTDVKNCFLHSKRWG